MRTKIRRPLGGFALSSFPHEAKDKTWPTDVKAMLPPIFLANQRGKRGRAGGQSQVVGEREEGVSLLGMMLERGKLTVFAVPGDREEQTPPSRGRQSVRMSEQRGQMFRCGR